jgi:hypothetical protein
VAVKTVVLKKFIGKKWRKYPNTVCKLGSPWMFFWGLRAHFPRDGT